MSAQKTDLIALTKVLGEKKKKTRDTDSQYVFTTTHIHGAVYREKGLLMTEEKNIKKKKSSPY